MWLWHVMAKGIFRSLQQKWYYWFYVREIGYPSFPFQWNSCKWRRTYKYAAIILYFKFNFFSTLADIFYILETPPIRPGLRKCFCSRRIDEIQKPTSKSVDNASRQCRLQKVYLHIIVQCWIRQPCHSSRNISSTFGG